jgi:hypothetical protein
MKRVSSTAKMFVALPLAAALGASSCVLASPSGDLPTLPTSRPTIVHPSVVPSTSGVLARFPATFLVPVELVDPSAPFAYATFVDYNPDTGEAAYVDGPVVSAYQASNTHERTRLLEIAIPPPLDLGRCHVIEVVVALTLRAFDSKTKHTPDEPGGDLVTWFYNPSGDVGGCPSLDAGITLSSDADAR